LGSENPWYLGVKKGNALPMNLTHLTNDDLLARTASLAQEERRITGELLHHLLEIDTRRLYVELGFRSLFDYLTKGLRYPEASAQRRIDGARALRSNPSVEEKLREGSLNLTTVGLAQRYFRAEAKQGNRLSQEEKGEVFEGLEGLSSREAEAKLAGLNPGAFPREKVRAVSEEEVQITFTADRELQGLFQRVREIHSHTDPTLSHAAFFRMLSEFYLSKKDPLRPRKARGAKRKKKSGAEPSRDSTLPSRGGAAVASGARGGASGSPPCVGAGCCPPGAAW